MRHTTTLNGTVRYELEPDSSDDRHIIEIMKGKGAVTMKQSNKGGIIFELEPVAGAGNAAVISDEKDELMTDLTNVIRLGKTEKGI